MLIFVFLTLLFDLLEQFHNSSLRYSRRFYIRCASSFFVFSFISLHGESFSTSSLTISENRCMVTFDHLGNQARNTEALINVILTMLRSKHLVKIVYFSPTKSPLSRVHLFQLGLISVCVMYNFYLIIAINLDFARLMPILKM